MRIVLPFTILCLSIILALTAQPVLSQVTLYASPFVENFDNISSGLPAGFTVRTGSTLTVAGANAPFTAAPVTWNNTSGAFKNVASATGLTASAPATEQNSATNRALGLRQSGGFGDPGGAFVFQIANTSNKTNFKLVFNLQSLDVSVTRTANWRVDYGIGENPTSFLEAPIVAGDLSTGGASFENSVISIDFNNSIDNLPDVITMRIITLVATSGTGNRPTSAIDDFSLSWTEGLSTAPTLILNDNASTSLNFPFTSINAGSFAQSFTVRGENLSEPVNISASPSFLVSQDSIIFSNLITLPVSEVVANKVIFVKFQPAAAGVITGSVVNSSENAISKTITVIGEGIDPANLQFDFNSCSPGGVPGGGFSAYSISGLQKWSCSGFGQSGSKGVDINGFLVGALINEDWLISPPLLIGGLNLPILNFSSRGQFTGPSLQLLVSTNYDGTSDPTTATWTDLNASFPPLTNTWTLTDGINLTAYKTFPHIYLAFKYTSDPELGAARWNIDDLSITNRTTLLSASPVSVDFSEVAVGTNSAGLPVNIQAFGFGALLLSAPAVYQLSADNLTFTDNLSVSGGQAETGAIVYIRFTPASKELKTTGRINFKSASLDSNLVFLSGSSFPKSETLDVAAYNLSFFGSTPNNNPTPEKILLQVNNIATIFQRLNMDVVGFEEMSNDDALASLLQKLPGYQSVTSPRWSYSFDPPDPGFPPQKIGFVYNATTAQLVEQRVMFESMYDSARNGLSTPLNNYPLNSPSSFWASGRLPFMATFDVTIKGVLERIRIIVIHGKSASDVASYNRRVYDVRVLKDSLDAYYPNDNIVLIGDFNDRVTGSILAGSPSPYMGFVDDSTDYAALTLPLDKAGRISFVSGTGLIDHIVISNELKDNYISNSTDIEDARSYIPNYNASTASDHLPVFSRFTLSAEIPLPVNILYFEARPVKSQVKVSWTTATELNNSHFIVERSGEVLNFVPMSKLDGAGTTTNRLVNYQFIDWFPLPGFNYYRLKQVDLNGKETFSQVVLVNMLPNTTETVSVYPNPVAGKLQIRITSPSKIFVAHLLNSNGNTILQAKGNINEINRHLNNYIGQLQSGLYILRLNDRTEWHTVKIIKQ